MKNYSQVGNRPGKPAYRTPAVFRFKNYLKTVKRRANFKKLK